MQLESQPRIKYFDKNYRITSNGEVFNTLTGKQLAVSSSGRYQTIKTMKEGKQQNYKLHRLIAFHFIPNPKNYPYLNHLNGNKHDNRLENLQWCTSKQNARHAVMTGLIKTGEESSMAKRSDYEMSIYFQLEREGFKRAHIAKKFNIGRSYLSGILDGKKRKSAYKMYKKADSVFNYFWPGEAKYIEELQQA